MLPHCVTTNSFVLIKTIKTIITSVVRTIITSEAKANATGRLITGLCVAKVA